MPTQNFVLNGQRNLPHQIWPQHLFELQLVIISGHTWAPFVCLRSAEKPQKECEGLVVDKAFCRGLDVKVSFHTVQTKTKTKTKPCERQKRHCEKLGCFDYNWSSITVIFRASSLSVKVRQFVAGSQFCPQDLGRSEV